MTAVDAATLKAQVSPVQKVIELLDDLKAKVQDELKSEEGVMEEYTKWCDAEANTKEDAITSAKRTISDLMATIEDASGSISTLTAEADELAAKISSNEADLEAATKIRADESKDFSANEKELSDTVDTLERALIVLKRGQTSFMQNKGAKKQLDAMVSSLSKIVEATWVNSRQKSVVQSLIQDEDLSLQPQATAAAYESQGGGILDVLAEMKDKAHATLSEARKTEMTSQHSYDMLKQGLETETAQMKKRLSQVTLERSTAEESKHAAQAELEATKKCLATDTKYLGALRQSCAAKGAEWAERQREVSEEVAVIEKAKEVLASGVKVFLQADVRKGSNKSEPRRAQLTAVLRNLAKGSHVFALSQLATEAESDPFEKVRGMIEAMIARLMEAAAGEADAKSFCDVELEKNRAKQGDLASTADMHAVRIEKAEAGIAKLKAQIKALQAEVAEIDAGAQEATKIRQDEATRYAAASEEYKQSADAVANAIQLLQEYYSQGAFLQRSAQPAFGSAKTDVASTIMEMLEVAESDFTRLLSESTASEDAAKAAYETLSQENAVTRAAKTEEAKGKESEVKSVELSLLNYKEDHASTSKQLDAVLMYLDKLKPQCETKVMTYAERKAAREQEIAGLQEALAILEG